MSESSISWNRVLPKPPALYHLDDRSDRQSLPLLQHHIVPIGEPARPADPARDRRNTIHGLPPGHRPSSSPPISPFFRAYPVQAHDSSLIGPVTRKRAASLMAEGSSPREGSPESENSNPEPTNQFCLCQPEPKIPRPRNAFILYRQHHQAAVVIQHPGLANPEISKIIGEQWKRLPDKQKNEWKALAEEEKARHQQQYPDYRYQPRRYNRSGVPISGNPSAPSTVGPTGHCTRCGGKVMNPPTTPNGPPSPITPASLPISAVYPGRPSNASRGFPRTGGYPPKRPGDFGQSSPAPPPQHHRHGYDPYGMISHAHQNQHPHVPVHNSRQPDPYGQGGPMSPAVKRRRFNGENVYIPPRAEPGHTPQTPYPYTATGRRPSLQPPEAIHPRSSIAMGPPVTARGVPPPPNITVRHHPRPPPPSSANNADPSLTLPPLQTSGVSGPPSARQQQRRASAVAVEATSGSGSSSRDHVERAVREIPVLHKIKTLARAAPPLSSSNPSVASFDQCEGVPGAVLAVEGSDAEDVNHLTEYLTEFLLKDGSFEVKRFQGPTLLQRSTFAGSEVAVERENVGQDADTQHEMTVQYLNGIAEWHEVSRELVRFICPPARKRLGDTNKSIQKEGEGEGEKDNSANPEKALARDTDIDIDMDIDKETETTQQEQRESSGSISPKTVPTAPRPPPTASIATNIPPSPPPMGPPSPSALDGKRPIALIPTYQLSTSDAAASSIPCLDTYTPNDHWQWVAALFRGCVGPDVTIVVRETEFEEESKERDGMPVEVRLGGSSGGGGAARDGGKRGGTGEINAVVVRKGRGERFEGTGKGERALRRVGFEVVEFLRR
ncbi:MAG: hypothetical protein Q9160_000996 [Pyrenula sp. 1 TL-2023]